MNKQELQYWHSITNSSKFRWTCDNVSYHNKKEILLYRGGESGIFISININGLLIAGKYKNALPHIGEAIFQMIWKKQFTSQPEAIKYTANKLNVDEILTSVFCKD